MARSTRQVKIIDLITNNNIETQEELAIKLQEAGFEVTQATVSRDIKELGLVKITYDGKHQKYAREANDRNVSNKVVSIFRQAVVSIDSAQNVVVVRTLSGSANVAASMIDRIDSADILGCVAGDDTIIAIARSTESAIEIVGILNDLIAER